VQEIAHNTAFWLRISPLIKKEIGSYGDQGPAHHDAANCESPPTRRPLAACRGRPRPSPLFERAHNTASVGGSVTHTHKILTFPPPPFPAIRFLSAQNLIFRFLQTKARIQIWLYENTDTVIEGRIIVSSPGVYPPADLLRASPARDPPRSSCDSFSIFRAIKPRKNQKDLLFCLPKAENALFLFRDSTST
jgi:hypothetical protein